MTKKDTYFNHGESTACRVRGEIPKSGLAKGESKAETRLKRYLPPIGCQKSADIGGCADCPKKCHGTNQP